MINDKISILPYLDMTDIKIFMHDIIEQVSSGRYFPNALLARVPQNIYDNIDYDGEPPIEFGPRRTVE